LTETQPVADRSISGAIIAASQVVLFIRFNREGDGPEYAKDSRV